MQQTLSINRGRLSVLVALVILSFALLPLIEAPAAGSVDTSFLGTPLRLDFTASTMVLVLATVLTCAGVFQLVRDHPRVRGSEVRRTFSYLILPAVTVIVAAQLLVNVTDTALWILGLIATAAVLWLTILAEYAVADPEGPLASRARLYLTALTYVLAALLFALTWNTRARSSISATLTLLAWCRSSAIVPTLLALSPLMVNRSSSSKLDIRISSAAALSLLNSDDTFNSCSSFVFIAWTMDLLLEKSF